MESGVECIYQAWREQSVNVGGYGCKLLTVSDLSGTLFPANAAAAGAGRQRLSSSAWLYACPA
jgi:hypothetical protein